MSGLGVAYDEVVDVNLKVWGDQWETRLGRLTAELRLPGPASGPSFRAWGHPVSIRGDVALYADGASLRAVDVPPEQFVELRVLFPRELLDSTAGAKVERGPGPDRIVAGGGGGGAGLPPPPPPLAQTTPIGSLEFTATLFALIRRGRYTAKPVTTEKRMWGGLRTEEVADLEIDYGDRSLALAQFEHPVAKVVDEVLLAGARPLSRFRDEIEKDRTENSERFSNFKSDVAASIEERGWYLGAGRGFLAIALCAFAVPAAILLWLGIDRLRSFAPRWPDIVLIAVGACLAFNALVLLLAATKVKLWRRRTKKAQTEAERWDAFRRYLTDFPRLEEAPPASLELWERYLVYGIAFGIAERVLQGANIHMAEALHDASTIYWISPAGGPAPAPRAPARRALASPVGP